MNPTPVFIFVDILCVLSLANMHPTPIFALAAVLWFLILAVIAYVNHQETLQFPRGYKKAHRIFMAEYKSRTVWKSRVQEILLNMRATRKGLHPITYYERQSFHNYARALKSKKVWGI